jgi:hypothetical protein
MRTVLMAFALLAAPAFASQSVWKWVDENGVTHYSDRPVQGAQRIELSTGARGDGDSDSEPSPSYDTPSYSPPARTETPITGYRDFRIVRPADDETIPNTGGAVDVRVAFEPTLAPGHSLFLYLDGRIVEDFPTTALEYTVQNVERGTHSLVAIIQDSSGKRIAETPAVRFHVRQTSIAQPPVGPALRQPTPRPRGTQAANKLPTSQPSYADLNGQRPQIDPRTNAPVPQAKK